MSSEQFERPTWVRHGVVGVLTLMAVLLYLDRLCVGFAVDYIREDLGLTQRHIAWFVSVFFWSYALAQVPSGWLSDRYGARVMLTAYILLWSVFTALIGAAHSLTILLLMRLGTGLAQAGAYPTSAGVLSRWVPFSNRATASAIVSFGGRMGGALAPVLTALLMLQFVPLDTPTEIGDGGLLNGPRLSARLTEAAGQTGDEPAPRRRVWQRLPDDVRPVVRRWAERYTEHAESSDGAERLRIDDPQDRRALRDALNSLIDDESLYDRTAFADLMTNREVSRAARRLERGEPVASAERRRMNRLLLEGTFPGDIRQLYVRGWRPVMVAYGAVGILVAGLFWSVFRNRPEEHPACNLAEQELIAAGRPPASSGSAGVAGAIPWGAILSDFSLWMSCVSQFTTNMGWVFLATWLPRYLLDQHHVPLLDRGMMVSVPLLVGIAGMLVGGRLTDRMTARIGLLWGRRLPMAATRFVAAAAYGLCLVFSGLPSGSWLGTPWAYVAAFSLVAFAVDMGTPPVWAYVQDVSGRYVGTILGWGNMWGNLGAAVALPLYDAFLGETPAPADWNRMFALCAAMFIVSGLCALGVDATRPVVPADEPKGDE